MSIRVLIVGLGRIGMGYDLPAAPPAQVCSHARAFSLHPDFTLAGGVDDDGPARETFERVYGAPSFTSVDTAIQQLQPGLVVIAVPTPLHEPVLRAVLPHEGVTAICCEKPLADDLTTARAMVRACAGRDVALFVNYIRRADPGAIEIKRRIDAGTIAAPIKGVGWYSKGLIHNGSHLVNLLEMWLGAVVDAQVIEAGRRWDGHDPEPDLRMTFERGTVTVLAAADECFTHFALELIACNGRLRYDSGGRRIEWQAADADPQFGGYRTLGPSEPIPSGLERYQWHVTEQLARALRGEAANICTGTQALQTLEQLHSVTAHL